jgi:peptidyl-prolyl cis-trans isomerase D
MLYLMRKHATSWVIKLVLSAIVIVFVFWGVGSFRDEKINRVAEVNGNVITIDQYYDAYNNLIEGYKRQFGDSFNESMLDALNIKQQVVNTLIERELILQETRRLNVRVTNEELAKSIQSISYFQKDGIFDNRYYINVLRRNRMSPEQFETSQRQSLLLGKLRELVMGSVKVSDIEAREWFDYNNEMVNLDYVTFESDSYTDISPTPEEIEAYYEANKDNYQTELEIKVAYVLFAKENYKSDITISDERIEMYYESHKSDFESPKTVEARHILFKADAAADSETDAAVKARANEIYEKTKEKDADFAKLAQEFSEGPSKDRGGYLGSFKHEDMVKPFSDKAFSMKAGEISEPVRTSFGWHIIKVENVNEAVALTLGGATSEIRQILIDEEVDNRAYDAAETFYDTIYDDSLTVAAKASGLSAVVTDFFGRRGPTTLFRDRYSFARKAFELENNQISDIVSLDKGYYIIQLLEKQEPFVQKLVVVQDRVEKDFRKDRQLKYAFNDALKCLKSITTVSDTESSTQTSQKESSLTQTAMAEAEYPFTSTGYFKRNEAIPEIGQEDEINNAAFELTLSNPVGYTVYKGYKGYYVIRLKDRKQPEEKEFEEALMSVKDTIRQKRESRFFDDWIKRLKMNSKIEIEDRFRESL